MTAKPKEQIKSRNVIFRMREALYDKMIKACVAQGLTPSEYLRALVSIDLERGGKSK